MWTKMKEHKISRIILAACLICLTALGAFAESSDQEPVSGKPETKPYEDLRPAETRAGMPLGLKSLYPTLGNIWKDLEVTLTGTGFDENTRISMYQDAKSRREIIGSWQFENCITYPQDITIVGDIAYVADGSSGLRIISISDPEHPVVISTVVISSASVHRVSVSGDIAYLLYSEDGRWFRFRLTDVSDPEHPVTIDSTDISGQVQDIAVAGDKAYAASGNWLKVIDLSDPEYLTSTGWAELAYRPLGLAVTGDMVYAACGNDGGLQVINVSDPEAPAIIGSVITPGSANHVMTSGNTAYVADGSQGLQVIDVSTPETPLIVGSADTPGNARSVFVMGDRAYVADGDTGLQVISVSDPENPVLMGSADTPGNAETVTAAGDRAYVLGRDNGLRIISVSVPEQPAIIGFMNTQTYVRNVTISGDMAYVACGSGGLWTGLQMIDVSNPERPVVKGFTYTPGSARSVSVRGELAYVADGYGLQIVDTSKPERLVITGSVNTPGEAGDVAVIGDRAYIADKDGLQVADVSDPANPVIIGSVNTPGYASGVAIAGDTVYVADSFGGLQVISVSNPAAPVIIGTLEKPVWARDIVISGNLAYVAAGADGFLVTDISDPEHPAIIGFASTPGLAERVAVTGNTAYVADGGSGLEIIDVSNPERPVIRDRVHTPSWAKGVAIMGDTAYVADGKSGLQVIDVNNLENPAIMTSSANASGYVCGVAVTGDTAYVVNEHDLKVMDVSDPGQPLVISSLNASASWVRDVAISGDKAYMLEEWGDLLVVDVSDPENPAIISSVYMPGRVIGLAIAGDTVCVAGRVGLTLVSVSDPENPVIITSIDTPGDNASGVAVAGDIAYVADEDSGLQLIDISDPENPAIIGSVDTPGEAVDVAVAGNTAYVADRNGGLQVADVSDPKSPAIISSVNTSGEALNVAVTGDTVYVAEGDSGLQIIDLSDPERPVVIASIDTPGYARDIAIADGTIYAADEDGGLSIMPSAPAVVTLAPQSFSIRNGTCMSLTLPAPRVSGHYTLRVHNPRESHELPGALTFSGTGNFQKQGRKKALIAAGKTSSRDVLRKHSRMCANHAFLALLSQGYTHERIQFLSPDSHTDADKDGVSDTDDGVSGETLEHAISEWAAEDTDELLIFMTGRGENGLFHLNENDVLTAAELDGWLDTFQEDTGARVILIYDACHSGSFIPLLIPPEGKERIIITSSASDSSARFSSDGTLSFSYQFWNSVFLNANLYDSFDAAWDMVRPRQTPRLDASGDGIGYLEAEKRPDEADRQIAKAILIGRGWRARVVLPETGQVSGEQTLSDETATSIQAWDIRSMNPITRVWAEITPPNHRYGPGDPVTDLPVTELEDPDGDGTYEGVWEGFYHEGTYQISVYATSEGTTETGLLYSKPAETLVIRTADAPVPQGDLNGDGITDMADIITGLRILSGTDGLIWYDYATSGTDVSSDKRIGYEEVFHILKNLSEQDKEDI